MTTAASSSASPGSATEELARAARRFGVAVDRAGTAVERFEREPRRLPPGQPRGRRVSSCTAALHLASSPPASVPGDEVITTPFTFVATVNAIEYVGATPRFVDIDPETLLIDHARVAAADRPAHASRRAGLLRWPAPRLDGLYIELADEHDLWIIEDAAHAVGAIDRPGTGGGRPPPSLLTCFSFYPNKNLASAEGGAIALADDAASPTGCGRCGFTASTPTRGTATGSTSSAEPRRRGGLQVQLDRPPGHPCVGPTREAGRVLGHARAPGSTLRRAARGRSWRPPGRSGAVGTTDAARASSIPGRGGGAGAVA